MRLVELGKLKKGHWWDAGGFLRWRVVRPLAWHLAGAQDRYATWRANRSRDIVR